MIECRKREELDYPCEAGDFYIPTDRKVIFIVMPGEKIWHSVNLDPANGRPLWTLSGTDDRPSLTPSLVIPGWHGFLTDGRLITA